MKRVVLVALLAGCHRDAVVADVSALVETAQPGDAIVATVDGRPIHASDVQVQARSTNTDAKTALSALVDAEVLAGEAAQRGLVADEDVVHAGRAQEGRRLIVTEFEPRVTASSIPDAELKRGYDKNVLTFDHPEYVEVWHLVVMPGENAPAPAQAKAHAQLLALLPAAKAAPTDEAFAALGNEHPTDGSLPVRAEKLAFPREGVVQPGFAAAGFQLAKPGQTSGPVESTFGWHVIRLVRREPERHTSFAEAKPELRDAMLATWREKQLLAWLDELEQRWGAIEHVDVLERLGEDSRGTASPSGREEGQASSRGTASPSGREEGQAQ